MFYIPFSHSTLRYFLDLCNGIVLDHDLTLNYVTHYQNFLLIAVCVFKGGEEGVKRKIKICQFRVIINSFSFRARVRLKNHPTYVPDKNNGNSFHHFAVE